MEKSEILDLVNKLPLSDRFEIIEEIIKMIRKEKASGGEATGKGILEFAGIIDNKEAELMREAVSESRKIDYNGW